jgi:hypothetical protein
MNIREKIARAIAKARVIDVDPDIRVFTHNLWRTRDGAHVMPPEDTTRALWQCYLDAADAALETIQKELEAAGIIVAWPKD